MTAKLHETTKDSRPSQALVRALGTCRNTGGMNVHALLTLVLITGWVLVIGTLSGGTRMA